MSISHISKIAIVSSATFYEIPDTGLSKKTKKKTSAESFVDKKVVCKHRSRTFKFCLPGWENYQLTISSRLGKLRMLLIN